MVDSRESGIESLKMCFKKQLKCSCILFVRSRYKVVFLCVVVKSRDNYVVPVCFAGSITPHSCTSTNALKLVPTIVIQVPRPTALQGGE